MNINTPVATTVITNSLLIFITSASFSLSHAGSSELPVIGDKPASDQKSGFQQLWDLATLYKDDSNPILQEFKLRGRYQGQYHWLGSSEGDSDGWENRRSRLGFDAKLFGKSIELRLDAQSNDEFDPFYDRLVDAYVKWKPSNDFSLTIGKQKPQIGWFDWLQSTNTQPTFERSQIFNQLKVDRGLGVVAEGKLGDFTWQAGAYSNEVDREFGHLEGGVSYGVGIGYDFKKDWALDRADWRLDWLHSEHQAEDTVLNRYDNLFSTTLWLEDGPWGLVAEAFVGTGETAADVFGFYLQPTFDLLPEQLQLVGRYSFATGDGSGSVSLQRRYEAEAPDLLSGTGDTYHAAYLGLQYFIYGDKLKFLAGAEYAHLQGGADGDTDALTFLTGVRVSF